MSPEPRTAAKKLLEARVELDAERASARPAMRLSGSRLRRRSEAGGLVLGCVRRPPRLGVEHRSEEVGEEHELEIDLAVDLDRARAARETRLDARHLPGL